MYWNADMNSEGGRDLETLRATRACLQARGGEDADALGSLEHQDWNLGEFLGSGTYNRVHKIRTRQGTSRVIRTSIEELHEDDIRSAHEEMQLASAMGAARIGPRIFAWRCSGNKMRSIQEVYEEGTLRDFLERAPLGRQDIQMLADKILILACRTAALGFLHWDLKPDNILVSVAPGGANTGGRPQHSASKVRFTDWDVFLLDRFDAGDRDQVVNATAIMIYLVINHLQVAIWRRRRTGSRASWLLLRCLFSAAAAVWADDVSLFDRLILSGSGQHVIKHYFGGKPHPGDWKKADLWIRPVIKRRAPNAPYSITAHPNLLHTAHRTARYFANGFRRIPKEPLRKVPPGRSFLAFLPGEGGGGGCLTNLDTQTLEKVRAVHTMLERVALERSQRPTA